MPEHLKSFFEFICTISMVFAWFLGLMKFKDERQQAPDPEFRKPEQEQVRSGEEKAASFKEFTKLPETRKFVSEWMKKKNFTRRGVEKLLEILWLQHDSNKKILRAAGDILSALTGEDGLLKVLSGFKLIPEGLFKIIKK